MKIIYSTDSLFFVYVDTNSHDPWVIRFHSKKYASGFEEIRVPGFFCGEYARCSSYTDPFNEARIGKYMLQVEAERLEISPHDGYARFV